MYRCWAKLPSWRRRIRRPTVKPRVPNGRAARAVALSHRASSPPRPRSRAAASRLAQAAAEPFQDAQFSRSGESMPARSIGCLHEPAKRLLAECALRAAGVTIAGGCAARPGHAKCPSDALRRRKRARARTASTHLEPESSRSTLLQGHRPPGAQPTCSCWSCPGLTRYADHDRQHFSWTRGGTAFGIYMLKAAAVGMSACLHTTSRTEAAYGAAACSFYLYGLFVSVSEAQYGGPRCSGGTTRPATRPTTPIRRSSRHPAALWRRIGLGYAAVPNEGALGVGRRTDDS